MSPMTETILQYPPVNQPSPLTALFFSQQFYDISARDTELSDPCKRDVCSTVSMWNSSEITHDNESTVTNVTGGVSQYHWEVLALLPIIVFGTTGNVLVCLAVSLEKRLQSVTNYFLLSLAVTDLLVSVVVMPFSMVHQFLGYWPFNYMICDLYVTSDVLMCTSSILHLCTISLERYLAIRSPLSVRNKSKSIVIIKIILVWALALTITSPITILGFIDRTNILNNRECQLTNTDFIIYGSAGAFFIPLGIMVISYALTIHLLHKQAKMCNSEIDNEGQPMIRRSTSRKAIKFRRHVPFASFPNHTNHEYEDYASLRAQSSKSCHPCSSHDMEMTPPSSPGYIKCGEHDLGTISEEKHKHNGITWRQESLTNTTCSTPSITESPKRLQNLVRKHQIVLKATSILLLRKESMQQKQEQEDVNTEQKASKVLGVVFAIFVICWAPFFVVNIMTVLCERCSFSPLLFTVFVWLGYISSTLNPIIYTMFNNTFKMTFIKLLKCNYGTMQKSLRVRWHSKNGYRSTFRTQSYYGQEDKKESVL